jgi:hypothetical protein
MAEVNGCKANVRFLYRAANPGETPVPRDANVDKGRSR